MSARVLIVDDSLTVRMSLMEALSDAGFDVVTATTVAEARQSLTREPFELIILDVRLPDGDGVDLLGEIRAGTDSSEAAIMLLSTEAEVSDRVRGLDTGADEYVGKPYDLNYVIQRAHELLRRGRPQAGPAPARETVLVIEDSVTFREQLKDALEGAGYAVIGASTGEEGLRLAASARPAAVIVDGQLPGIDGGTVTRRIRMDAALRHMPCILLTGSEEREAEVRALDAGADAFVRKDEDVDVLLARLGAVLRSVDGPRVGERSSQSLMGPKKILAVDDSETYLQQVAQELRAEGYDVVLARGGAGIAWRPAGRLHPARPDDAGDRRARDLPPDQGHADPARHSRDHAHGARESRGDDPGARCRGGRLHLQVERFRGAAFAGAGADPPQAVRGRE